MIVFPEMNTTSFKFTKKNMEIVNDYKFKFWVMIY